MGVCKGDGVCDCITGSTGTLCYVPPLGDGKCDLFFNTAEHAYDGGDCCEETCEKGPEFECGSGKLSNSYGVKAFGHIGFPNCTDPVIADQIAGSHTLFEIFNRGYLVCGAFRSPMDGVDKMYRNHVSRLDMFCLVYFYFLGSLTMF